LLPSNGQLERLVDLDIAVGTWLDRSGYEHLRAGWDLMEAADTFAEVDLDR
jgi:hypothetical protein